MTEQIIENISFNIIKNNNRSKPSDPKKIIILFCFAEFGCESLLVTYLIPRIQKDNPDCYFIAVGWYGRDYLYRHLVDEYWELKEEFQFLREYVCAFHHKSINLKRLEKILSKQGKLISHNFFGVLTTVNHCNNCKYYWSEITPQFYCKNCLSGDITPALLGNAHYWRPKIKKIPLPSKEKMELAKSFLKENPVGIFARGRKLYGRNLSIEFYKSLIKILLDKGYNPIWLGEKVSTLECPDPNIFDFSRDKRSQDLELTLAIIAQLKFTIQFFTASTRLASMVGTPYILFESSDQICALQEGKRLDLMTFGKSKIVHCDYYLMNKNLDQSLQVVKQILLEIENDNWREVPGVTHSADITKILINKRKCYA